MENYCHDDLYGKTTDSSSWYDINATQWANNTTTTPMYETETVFETVFEIVTGLVTESWDMNSATTMVVTNATDGYYKKCTSITKPLKHQPNTALLSTILMLGTFCLAWVFKMLRSSKFLGKKVMFFSSLFQVVLYKNLLAGTSG